MAKGVSLIIHFRCSNQLNALFHDYFLFLSLSLSLLFFSINHNGWCKQQQPLKLVDIQGSLGHRAEALTGTVRQNSSRKVLVVDGVNVTIALS